MTIGFAILSAVTIASAIAAVTLRNLVHCALALVLTFGGVAALYLQLGAEFVGFAQFLVYIGAVAILIVVAILLTPTGGERTRQALFSPSWILGGACACAVFVLLGGVMLRSRALPADISPAPPLSVRELGDQLMNRYVLPLEVLGILLTAALIGAVLLAMHERRHE